MKYISLIILIIILAILGAVSYRSVKSGTSAVEGKTFIIELKDDGFYPKEVKIKKNDTIQFINKASRSVWPASDLHPSHDIYPEFDPKKPIAPGGSFRFNFQKVGTWYFHDHLRPNLKGLVIVEDQVGSLDLDQLRKKCPEGKSNINSKCLEEEVRKQIREGRVKEAFDLVATYYVNAPAGSRICHGLAHIIGEETYHLFAKGVDFDISPKSAYCAYGFYHGFMERLVQETKDLKQASTFCAKVDQKLAKYAADAQLQCYHGIGHGTATSHDPAVLGDEWAILTPALKLCEKVSSDYDQLYRCASGAFNAIALYYVSGEYNLPLNQNDPLRLCRQQEDRHKESCYGNMNVLLTWLFKGDLVKAAPFVEQITEDKYAVPAIRYLSAIMAIDNLDKTDNMVRICRTLRESLRAPCVVGIGHGIIEHGKPGIEYIEALNFCRSEILTEEERLECYNQAFGFFSSIYPKEKTIEICASVKDYNIDYCKRNL